jgi:hypothetical protein
MTPEMKLAWTLSEEKELLPLRSMSVEELAELIKSAGTKEKKSASEPETNQAASSLIKRDMEKDEKLPPQELLKKAEAWGRELAHKEKVAVSFNQVNEATKIPGRIARAYESLKGPVSSAARAVGSKLHGGVKSIGTGISKIQDPILKGTAIGAVTGGAGGAVSGLLDPKEDPITGEKQRLRSAMRRGLSGAAGGAATGALFGSIGKTSAAHPALTHGLAAAGAGLVGGAVGHRMGKKKGLKSGLQTGAAIGSATGREDFKKWLKDAPEGQTSSIDHPTTKRPMVHFRKNSTKPGGYEFALPKSASVQKLAAAMEKQALLGTTMAGVGTMAKNFVAGMKPAAEKAMGAIKPMAQNLMAKAKPMAQGAMAKAAPMAVQHLGGRTMGQVAGMGAAGGAALGAAKGLVAPGRDPATGQPKSRLGAMARGAAGGAMVGGALGAGAKAAVPHLQNAYKAVTPGLSHAPQMAAKAVTMPG